MSARGAFRRRANAVLAAFRRRPTSGRVLLYHEIGDGGDPTAVVTPQVFRSQLGWLAAHGMRTVTVRQLLVSGLPPNAVALTFDDGYASAVDACAELVRARNTATTFVVPGWIDASRHGVCAWSDIVALADRGIEVGAHDLEHERPCGTPVRILAERYRAARLRIEDKIGTAVDGLAYPYGLAPDRARSAALLAGYAYAVTSEPGRNTSGTDPFRIRRNEMHGTDATESAFVGKLAGSDDWFAPIRRLENRLACG